MYIDTGGAAATAALGAIGAGMATLKQAAVGKAFAVSETGGQALLTAIQDMKDWIELRRDELRQLADQPPLGGTYGANTMRDFVPQVASDGQGFLTMLDEFGRSLDDAAEGIRMAMDNYREMEVGNVQRLNA